MTPSLIDRLAGRPLRVMALPALIAFFCSSGSVQTGQGLRVWEAALPAGGSQSYSISLKGDQFVQFTIEQQGIDVATSIRDAAGKALHRADWRWNGVETLSWLARSPGSYQIEVTAIRKAGAAGKFILRESALRGRSAQDPAWIDAEGKSTSIKEEVARGAALAPLTSRLDDALMLWRQLNYRPGIAQLLNVRGYLENASGKAAVALETYADSLAYRQAAKDIAGQAETLHNIAAAHNGLGKPADARNFYEQALALRREAGDLEGVLFTLGNLAAVHFVLGDVDAAINVNEEALRSSQQIADSRAEAQARINLAAILSATGEAEDALVHLQRALTLVQRAKDVRGEAYVLGNLANVYLNFADYALAIRSLEPGVELMRRIGDRRGEGRLLINMAASYHLDGKSKPAVPYLEQALRLFRETNDRLSQAQALQMMSRVQLALGNIDYAIGANDEALSISKAIGDTRGEASALRSLAEIESTRGNTSVAIQALREARVLFETIRYRDGEADALLALARLSWQSGARAEALDRSQEALRLIESQREKVTSSRLRGTYFASKRDHYAFYIDALMQTADGRNENGRAAEALAVSERARARLLLDTVPLSRIGVGNAAEASLNEARRRLRREIATLAQQLQTAAPADPASAERTKKLDRLLLDLEDVEARAVAADSRYRSLVAPPVLGLEDIQKQLGPNTLLLQYSLGETRSFLWAVTASSFSSFSNLPARAEIDRLVRALMEAVRVRSAVDSTSAGGRTRIKTADLAYTRIAGELSEKLLGPVANALPYRVVIVGDGALHFVPFAALPAPGASGGGPLIDNHEVVSLPSISLLAALRKETASRNKPAGAIAVLADPVYSSTDPRIVKRKVITEPAEPSAKSVFPRLIYTRQEARSILALAPRGQSLGALDFDASLQAAMNPRLGSFRIIHFGVHGAVDTVRPSMSSLVFSLANRQGDEQDGFLRLYQIYNLNLPVDLVVLGACETAMGAEIRGEGLESLSRGFMHAGASRVVASLWQVNDRTTAELMKAFYRRILAKDSGISPATALREAQLELKRDRQRAHPYYWAGFLFIGDWN